MHKKQGKSRKNELPEKPWRLATVLSIVAIILSAGSWFLNYTTSLPVMSPKVELVEPLIAGHNIHFKVLLDNYGKSTAKQLHPTLAFEFSRADIPFKPNYDLQSPKWQEVSANWQPTVSDLPPGGHSTIYSTNRLTLQHEHDLAAVLSGQWNMYLYGKISYKDFLHISHEVHFCGVYRQVPGADPLKLSLCPSYNETD